MENLFLSYGVKLNKEQIDKFQKYADLLIEFNAKFNLTAITERSEIYLKHFLDSALGVDKVCGKTLIDIGSGGGFPALRGQCAAHWADSGLHVQLSDADDAELHGDAGRVAFTVRCITGLVHICPSLKQQRSFVFIPPLNSQTQRGLSA